MRKRTGSIEWRGGKWQAKISQPDKSRPWIPMPGIPREDEAKAREVAAIMAREAMAGGYVPEERGETVNEFAARWVESRKAKPTSRDDASRLRIHVEPILGHLPMRAVSREHLEDFVEHLDRRVAAGELSWRMARHVWGTCSKMFKDAASAKRRALRILDANPATLVAPPEKGEEAARQYLYPDELLRLVACAAVPLVWRQLYAVAVYTWMRSGELTALLAEDVDLDHASIHVHRNIDRTRDRSKVKGTKTGHARRIPIEANLLPLLALLVESVGPDGLVVPVLLATHKSGIAAKLRSHLKASGVTRRELFERTATSRAMTFHDLRATGITWAAVEGLDVHKLMQRAGHEVMQTTLRYIREAELLRDGFGQPFPELPAELLKRPRSVQTPNNGPFSSSKVVARAGFESDQESPEAPDLAEVSPDSAGGKRPDPSVLEGLVSVAQLAAKAGQWRVVERVLEAVRAAAPEAEAEPAKVLELIKGGRGG